MNFIIRMLCYVHTIYQPGKSFKTTYCIQVANLGHYGIHSLRFYIPYFTTNGVKNTKVIFFYFLSNFSRDNMCIKLFLISEQLISFVGLRAMITISIGFVI